MPNYLVPLSQLTNLQHFAVAGFCVQEPTSGSAAGGCLPCSLQSLTVDVGGKLDRYPVHEDEAELTINRWLSHAADISSQSAADYVASFRQVQEVYSQLRPRQPEA